ncbi:aminotransferase class III-fold pyridoxal phosphate-dependent enzyme [Streptomyces sp. NPDC031705]|uniref:aminotransferase class III-fold pyridoxal phosphate-dependent enzyme n=1 Tax=Streptomyces sp. NPDC031705 TaxID=3155729 RepID=UPI0033F8B59D
MSRSPSNRPVPSPRPHPARFAVELGEVEEALQSRLGVIDAVVVARISRPAPVLRAVYTGELTAAPGSSARGAARLHGPAHAAAPRAPAPPPQRKDRPQRGARRPRHCLPPHGPARGPCRRAHAAYPSRKRPARAAARRPPPATPPADYGVQFPGPVGTNALEAAPKPARKVTGRHTVAYFTHGFHGMTLGALAVTANPAERATAGLPLPYTVPVPFDDPADDDEQASARLTRSLDTAAEDPLATVVVETVQGEGGINTARPAWLRTLASWTREHGTLLVVDDVHMGCGRTGPFFSFEPAGIVPDIVCLSKSTAGTGCPWL